MHLDATAEDKRIRELHEEKERKLKRFQEDVKLRVQKLEKHKHQQQLQKSYEAVCNFSDSILMNRPTDKVYIFHSVVFPYKYVLIFPIIWYQHLFRVVKK